MLNPDVGLLDLGGVQCSGIVSPFSVLDLPVLGATTSYRTSTTLLTTALSSTSMPVMGYTLLEAICVAIGAENTWITRGGGCASCTCTSFQVLKLLHFTSFEDTELIPWDKAKETLLRLATTPPPPTARICFLMEYEGFLICVGSKNDQWFYVDVQGSPRAPSGGALYTEFSTLADLVDVVLLPNGLARTATSPNEAQACRIWTVTVRAKILPGTVAKGTLGRCTVQDIRRKLTEDCAVIIPMLQSAHIIATPADVHEVLRTLGVVQMQTVAPPTLQAPMPPGIYSDSSAQMVRPGNNVQEYQKAYNASTGDHWFCLCRKKLSRSVRPSSSTFEQHCKTSQQHLRFMQENRPLQPRERTLLTFFPAKRSSGNPSPQSTPTMLTATSTPITEQSVVPTELPLPPPPCPKVLPFGIKDANHLHRAYPLLRHGHEKASWRLVDGLGLESVDPPCIGEGSYDSTGCIVPCSPCASVRGSVVLHRWMVEAREPDKGVQHWKLGFEALCIRADGHRREKRTVSQKLARSIHRCQHLMNKYAESKALILAVAYDDRPLLQRRVARLIGAGHSPSAVMADMSKAFKIRTYTEKEKAIAGLAALGVGGCEFLKVANRGGILPSYDTAMVDMKFEEPLRPGIAPTRFILKRPPNHPDPLLWDLLVDEISLQPQIGVVKSGHATGTCRTCTSREHRLVDQETVDELANLLEDSNSNVHLAEYATVWSVAAHHGSLYRPFPLATASHLTTWLNNVGNL